MTGLPDISFVAGLARNFVNSTFSCSCNRVGAMGFMRWCNVVVVLNAMPIFVFLNKLVIFLIFGLWKVNVVLIFFVILVGFFVVDFV